ncbi:hypothetical protein MTO96_051623 [Rhipicephalus appendiculatus]
MADESPPCSATPVERPRRSLPRTSSHRRSESVACTRMLWNIIGNANAARLRHEQAQRLCKVVSDQPTTLHRPGPASNAAAIARDLAISGAHCVTVSTAVSSGTSATLPTALPGVLGIVEPGPDDMDTTSTRKRSRPSESDSNDEGASRKLQAVATEHLTVTAPTTPSSDAVADEHSATRDANATNQTDFQLVLSKSQKRRQRTATSPRPDTSVDTPPGTTTAAHPSFTRYVPACATQLSATQPAVVGDIAAADTIRPSASSPPACGTVLFRPANIGASCHRSSRLAIAQALSALPGVKEGVDGEFTDEALLAAVTSEVPVIAAMRQGTSLVLRFASPVPPARQRQELRCGGGSSNQGGRDLDPFRASQAQSSRGRLLVQRSRALSCLVPPTKATSESHLDQENTNLRLLLRAVADLLPPENQLRSICLQAGGVPPPNSHHG